MDAQTQHLDTLKDIKKMMERSSRFISLSGLSGIAAGCCALVGAWFAYGIIHGSGGKDAYNSLMVSDVALPIHVGTTLKDYMGNALFRIAFFTFISAFVLAFIFTYIRSKKNHTPIWTRTSKRLLINVCVPLAAGGFYLLKLVENGAYGLIAPGCLIFYGLALINGSKYTLGEIKYLGYGQVLLGVINLLFIGQGLYFWALGFGVLHIVYGAIMWWKYEKVR